VCYGEDQPNSKLNQKQVNEIRQKYIPRKYTAKMLAEEYNVSISCIKCVIENRTWKERSNEKD
jgi:hypothetical protein